MSTVWGSRGEGSFGKDPGDARTLRDAHQKKEMELEEAQDRLSKRETAVREQKTELARVRQARDALEVERVRLEQQQRELERNLADSEREVAQQRARVSRLEHEAEVLREQRYRGRAGSET